MVDFVGETFNHSWIFEQEECSAANGIVHSSQRLPVPVLVTNVLNIEQSDIEVRQHAARNVQP